MSRYADQLDEMSTICLNFGTRFAGTDAKLLNFFFVGSPVQMSTSAPKVWPSATAARNASIPSAATSADALPAIQTAL